MINNLSVNSSILNHFVAELRDITVQKDPLRFRRNLERIGEVIGYEISKGFSYSTSEVTTPLGVAEVKLSSDDLVLATILRAGLPLHQGLLNIFDKAQNAFISAYRKHHKDGTFDIQIEYMACPNIDGKIVILSDPMLATGSSIVLTYQNLLRRGTPAKVHIVTAIASAEGLEYVKAHLPADVEIWCAAVDEELTAQAYIVPGLGDAGDLAFGEKI